MRSLVSIAHYDPFVQFSILPRKYFSSLGHLASLIRPSNDGCRVQAPTPMDEFRVDREKCTAPEVPRVCLPVAPLGPIELPRSDSFGPTSPVPPVGRSDGEDGGIPRRVERRTATVMPPFFLTPACTERVAKAVWTCVGESKGC